MLRSFMEATTGADLYMHPQAQAPASERYFFGENYRACFDAWHIVDVARVALVVDTLKTIGEVAFFTSKIGYLDTLSFIRVAWFAIAACFAVIGFAKERFFFFWPIVINKLIECLINLVLPLLLVVLAVVHRPSLESLMKWTFPRLEQPLSFVPVVVLACVTRLILDGVLVDFYIQVQYYLRRKASVLYFMERQKIMACFV